MNIKEAEKLSGVSIRNIRFYEEKGLLAPVRNKDNDYREYSDADIRQLMLIRALRMVDMPLDKIREVVDGEVTLHDAALAQKEKLDEKIEQLKVATKFCAELAETEPENVKEVLERMDQPENRKELFKKWKEDHRQTFVKLGLSFYAGLAFPILTYFTIYGTIFMGAFLELAGVGQREGAMWLAYLTPLLLWCYTAYKLYERKWWLLEAVLAHLCLAALVFLPKDLELYTLRSFVLWPTQPLLQFVPDLRDTTSVYAMQLSFWMILGFFLLGILLAMVRDFFAKFRKVRTGKVAQYFARHPLRKKAVKALILMVLMVSFASIKRFTPLTVSLSRIEELINHRVNTQLVATTAEKDLGFWIESELAETMSLDQWEPILITWGKGDWLVSISNGNGVGNYLVWYENDVVGVKVGDEYAYYRVPEGTADKVWDYIQEHLEK